MRDAQEGQFIVSLEGCALQLLRDCNVHPDHLVLLLQPFGGLMPNTEQQLQQLTQQLRRQGHLWENAPGNVATLLRGPFRQARPGAYLAEQEWSRPGGIPQTASSSSQEPNDVYWGTSPPGSWGPNPAQALQPAPWQTPGGDSSDRGSAWWGVAACAPPPP